MWFIGTAKIGTHALGQLLGRKQSVGFNDGPLAMDPLRLYGVEPGTFGRQKAWEDADTLALGFHLGIVLAYPGANDLASMPGSIVPNEQPSSLPLLCQALTAPVEKLGRNVADRASADKAQPHLFPYGIVGGPLLPEDTITGEGFGVRISFLPRLLDQTHWLVFILPSVHARQGKATPPDFIEEANRPIWLLTRPGDQPISCCFFLRYRGSGLVIQGLARFQLVFSRLRARRTLSSEIRVRVIPCSKLIWAANSRVQVLRSWPKSCGLRCRRSLRRSAPSSENAVWSRWGREEPSHRTASPEVLKPWITL